MEVESDLEVFEMLMCRSPDLTLLTSDGKSYLELALTNFSPAISLALLQVWPLHLQFYQQETRESWLHFTAKTGMVEQAELLLQCGQDVEARDANLQSALHYAVFFNQVSY